MWIAIKFTRYTYNTAQPLTPIRLWKKWHRSRMYNNYMENPNEFLINVQCVCKQTVKKRHSANADA